MAISRRGFLGWAAGLSTIGLASGPRWARVWTRNLKGFAGCTLVDPGSSCALRESVAGYESALASLNIDYKRASFQSFQPAGIVILPAVARVDKAKLAQLRGHLDGGSTVLFESGAAFLNPKEFDSHRRFITSAYGVCLHTPIRLWDSADSFKQSPYVDYRWPVVMKVRDFSRVIPVECKSGEAIAWFQSTPVAAKCRMGQGTLVFLGSPLGPHLLAGDREARNWFGATCSTC
jgi:hypothetical protein